MCPHPGCSPHTYPPPHSVEKPARNPVLLEVGMQIYPLGRGEHHPHSHEHTCGACSDVGMPPHTLGWQQLPPLRMVDPRSPQAQPCLLPSLLPTLLCLCMLRSKAGTGDDNLGAPTMPTSPRSPEGQASGCWWAHLFPSTMVPVASSTATCEGGSAPVYRALGTQSTQCTLKPKGPDLRGTHPGSPQLPLPGPGQSADSEPSTGRALLRGSVPTSRAAKIRHHCCPLSAT